jgi:hypothetical protein
MKDWKNRVSISAFNTIYLTKNARESEDLFATIAHEVCHYVEKKRVGALRFYWGYLSPQLGALVVNIPLIVGLCFLKLWLVAIVPLVFMLFQALPFVRVAFDRAHTEGRGYALGEVARQKAGMSEVGIGNAEEIGKTIAGATYFWPVSPSMATALVSIQIRTLLLPYDQYKTMEDKTTTPWWYLDFAHKTFQVIDEWRSSDEK